jgi:hypothetical protein
MMSRNVYRTQFFVKLWSRRIEDLTEWAIAICHERSFTVILETSVCYITSATALSPEPLRLAKDE